MSSPICFITPRLPPSIDGLGDYCRQLWLNWPGRQVYVSDKASEKVQGPDWDFLVTAGAHASRQLWPEVSIREFRSSKEGLIEALQDLNPSTLVIQYVGYGYDQAGQPFWLPQSLRSWQDGSVERRVIVMFHETWATGRPWQRVFWQSGRQRKCAYELLELASSAVTSNQATLRDLRSLKLSSQIDVIPLGPSFNLTAGTEKGWRKLLVFGKEYSRLRAIRTNLPLIRAMAEASAIDSIVLAGECLNPAQDSGRRLLDKEGLPVAITSVHNFPSDNLPDEILSCGLSMMHTQSTCLTKSTSFQLACQLGQVPITIQELDPGEPIVEGKHYLGYSKDRFDDVFSALAKPDVLLTISQDLRQLGDTCFSWREIALSWSKLLRGSLR